MGDGAGFCGPQTRCGIGECDGLEEMKECGVRVRLMLKAANRTGPWKGWSEDTNPDCSEPNWALNSSERKAPILESQKLSSGLCVWG